MPFDFKGRQLVAGVGSALIDILAHENDDFIAATGAIKGGMTLVDQAFIDRTLSLTGSRTTKVPGGSACNTIIGVSRLGGRTCFMGKCGQGEYGRLFEADLQKNNVVPTLFASDAPTGRCLSIITPDAQRTMFTFLGAAADMRPQDLSPRLFQNAAIVHIEGYLLFNRDLILAAMTAAKQGGACISLDLGSLTVVQESQDILPILVRDFVDILIANEDEARALTGLDDEIKALHRLAQQAAIAVVNVGARGSYICHLGQHMHIAAAGSDSVVDTTGAGDLWASGFLFGLVNQYPLEKCALLGARCGYEVCRVIGANIPDAAWKKIKIETDHRM